MDEQHKSSGEHRRRLLFFSFVGVGAISVVWFLSATLYMKYQGTSLVKYCNDSLIGESSSQVVARARKAGFETLQGRDMILLTMPGKQHGRTCYLSLRKGVVSDAKSAFRW